MGPKKQQNKNGEEEDLSTQELLSNYTVNSAYIEPLEKQLRYTWENLTETSTSEKKALALKSTNPNINSLLAWSLLKQDKLTEAVGIFENLYDQNPKELFFAQALAEIYSKHNLQSTTKEMINRSLDIRLSSNHTYNTYFEEVNQTAKINAINGQNEKVIATTVQQQSEEVEKNKAPESTLRRLPASLEVFDSPEKK